MKDLCSLTVFVALPLLAACSGRAVDLDHPTNATGGAGGAAPGVPELVIPDETAVELTTDAERLYWRTDTGYVRSCRKGDCANSVVTYASEAGGTWSSATRFRNLGVSGNAIFWQSATPTFTVYSCPIEGCGGHATRVLVDEHAPYGFSTDTGYVYWSSAFDIYRCPASGCGHTPEVVAARSKSSTQFEFEGDDVLWVDGGIWSAPKDGSHAPTELVDVNTLSGADALAVNAAHLYWVDSTGQIWQCPRTGCKKGEPPTLLVATDTSKWGFEVDASHLFWLEGLATTAGTAHYCALTGCADSSSATPEGIYDFAIDDTSIYWSDADFSHSNFTGTNIHRMLKPE